MLDEQRDAIGLTNAEPCNLQMKSNGAVVHFGSWALARRDRRAWRDPVLVLVCEVCEVWLALNPVEVAACLDGPRAGPCGLATRHASDWRLGLLHHHAAPIGDV